MKLQFEGAARTVTGSQTLITTPSLTCLVDCGLYQGPQPLRALNWEKPSFIQDVSAIILTHAHIDHSGLLPRWAKWGWSGPIFCTPSTADLLQILLLDAARLQEEDARFANRTKYSRHDPALPLYTEEDALRALSLLVPHPFNQWRVLSSDVEFRFLRAGHILGSAMVQFRGFLDQEGGSKTLLFSGDLGGGHSDLIKDPCDVLGADILVLESTYGDRKVNYAGREERLAEVIRQVIGRGGTLIIPAFALGRTQDLLYSIHQLQNLGQVPDVPVYLDSPMAHAVTQVYLKNREELKVNSGPDHLSESLSPRFFHEVETADDSMLLCLSDEPKIVLSASGMLQGGRVLHHLKRRLSDPRHGVLFVGYQGQGTKGRLLQDGIKSLRIHHQEIAVEAEIFTIEGYSAHADADDLINWFKTLQPRPQKVFLNHGEYEGQKVFADRLRREFDVTVFVPDLHESF